MKDLNRYRGCLIGGAAGDALGYPVEFMKYSEIKKRFGSDGITEYVLDKGLARISDDTQMTLFTATGILHGETRGCIRGIMGDPWSYVWLSYKDWYRTQTEKYPLDGYHYSWLDDVPGLYCRRAPGNTCLSVLSVGREGSVDNPINDSKGCGGVMRVAPIGLYFGEKRHYSIEMADQIGAEAAALTHGHPLGYMPAAVLVHIINRILTDRKHISLKELILEARDTAAKIFRRNPYLRKMTEIIDLAVRLSENNKRDIENIHAFGEGWVAEETLGIALYCALKYQDDFSKGIIAAVNHNGDSDSTGAVTGNILGALIGCSGIDEKWKKDLELSDVILEIADDLCHGCQTCGYYADPTWVSKYVYMVRFRGRTV